MSGHETPRGFPTVAWGRGDTAAARLGQRFVASKLGSAVVRALVPLDRRVLVRTGGRRTVLGPFGTPLLLLTTTGSVSGQPRTTPLVYLHDRDAILVVGSNFGQSRHPAWSTNLVKDPVASVTIGGADYPVLATLLGGDERRAAWSKFADAAEPYRVYVTRTDREIRVFRLTLRGSG